MGAKRTRWKLPPDASSVVCARHRIIDLLEARGWDDDHIDAVALMISELTTNAVEHAATTFTVTVDVRAAGLRVEVHDANEAPPIANRVLSPNSVGGRGLRIVAALADRWGCEPTADGKSVWFETRPLVTSDN